MRPPDVRIKLRGQTDASEIKPEALDEESPGTSDFSVKNDECGLMPPIIWERRIAPGVFLFFRDECLQEFFSVQGANKCLVSKSPGWTRSLPSDCF